MKKIYISFALMALAITSCKKEVKVEEATVEVEKDTVVQQEPAPEQPMDSVAMQKAWEAYATPGDVHKMLAEETGKWDVTMTFWMEPGAEPQVDKATADVKMIMGGRYQEMTFTGKMMGMDWIGKSTVAYNNKSKEITSTFIDNSGTGMMVVKGPYDAEKKSFSLKGETVDPMTGQTVQFREVYTFVDDNTRRMDMFDTKNGKPEYKSLEIVMTRK
jgi:hypothetical protein